MNKKEWEKKDEREREKKKRKREKERDRRYTEINMVVHIGTLPMRTCICIVCEFILFPLLFTHCVRKGLLISFMQISAGGVHTASSQRISNENAFSSRESHRGNALVQ